MNKSLIWDSLCRVKNFLVNFVKVPLSKFTHLYRSKWYSIDRSESVQKFKVSQLIQSRENATLLKAKTYIKYHNSKRNSIWIKYHRFILWSDFNDCRLQAVVLKLLHRFDRPSMKIFQKGVPPKKSHGRPPKTVEHHTYIASHVLDHTIKTLNHILKIRIKI